MATQFDQSRTIIQPQAAEQPQDLSSVFERQAAALSRESEQQYATAGQAIQQTSAVLGQALDVFNDDAKKKAAEEAPAAVTRDGNGMLVKPSTFYPPGLHSRAYAEAYKTAFEASYTQTAVQDFENHSALMKAQHSADPAGYSAAMEQKRRFMVEGLDPKLAPFIDLRLQQVMGQGTTQVSVNLTAQNNEVMKAQATREIDSIVDTASRQNPVDIATNEQMKALGEGLINDKILGKRLEGAEAQLRRAGYGEDFIKENRRELGFKIQMATMTRAIRGQVAVDQATGKVDGKVIADWQTKIYDYASRFPGREAAIIQHLNGALGDAVNQSSRISSGIQLRQQQGVDANNVQVQQMQLIANDPATPTEFKQNIRDALRLKAMDALTNPALNDNIKLQYAAGAAQAGALSNAAYQQAVSGTLLSLGDVVKNPDSTNQQRAGAEAEFTRILSSPSINNNLTPEQQHFARGQVAELATRRIAGNFQLANIQANDPDNPLTVEAAVKLGEEWTAKGLVGPNAPIPPAALAGLIQTATNNDARRRADFALLAQMDQGTAAGTAPTPDMVAANDRRRGFVNPVKLENGQPAPYDGAHPATAEATRQFVDKYQYMPKDAQQWIAGLPRTEDVEALKPYTSMFNNLMRSSTAMGFKDREAQYANVAKMIGEAGGQKVVKFMRILSDLGPQAAARFAQNASNSTTANQGGPTGPSDTKLDGKVDAFITQLQAEHEQNGLIARLRNGQLPLSNSPEQQQADAMFAGLSQKEVDRYDPSQTGKVAPSPGFEPTGASISPSLRAQLTREAAELKASSGEVMARLEAENGDVDKWALRQVWANNKDNMERRIDPSDPSKVIIDYKTFNSDRATAIGVPYLVPEAERGLMQGVVKLKENELRQRAKALGGEFTTPVMHSNYDPSTLNFSPERGDDGKMRWNVTAKRGSNIDHVMYIAQDDKLLNGYTSQLTRTIASEADKWFPNRESATAFGQLVAGVLTNPINKHIYNEKAQNILSAQSDQKRGWEEAWVDAVRTVKDIWTDTTGQAPSKDDQAGLIKARDAASSDDKAAAAQIRRFGLLHYFFTDTADSQTPLLPPMTEEEARRAGKASTAARAESLKPILPGASMQPYQSGVGAP